MDALAEVHNEETCLQDADLLPSSSVLAGCSSVAHPVAPAPLASASITPYTARGESVGLHCDHCGWNMWRHFAIGRRKLRRLKLAVLHRVLVALVLEDLGGILLVQTHRSCSCYFITLRPLRHQELLVM
jgi:hypothetical protein